MKINDTSRSTVPQAALARATKDVEKAGLEKVASDIGAKQSISKPMTSSSNASALTFDSKRVDAIKLAIASGTFEVNPEKIADGLIKSVQENLSRK